MIKLSYSSLHKYLDMKLHILFFIISLLWLNRSNSECISCDYFSPKVLIPWLSDYGYYHAINLLLFLRTDPNYRRRFDGKTPLMISAMNNNTDIAKIIINYGGITWFSDKDGRTALMLASIKGSTNIVKIILEKKDWVDQLDKNRKNALFYAIENNHSEIVVLLLAYGSDCKSIFDGKSLIKIAYKWLFPVLSG